jgi:[glutamine synthetase] adenylyltransferase / [glutamine synthetase]-adenylyl-L-tyrosine phosphorylase
VITPETLGRALGEAPDPQMARVAVSRLGERPVARELLSRSDIIPAAGRLLGFSSAAADFFTAHPEELEELADVRRRSAAELDAECGTVATALGPAAGLRRFRRRAGYRVAVRDLAGASVDEVVGELTAIAEACLRTAVASVPPDPGISVVGLGKLGGRELNYSSDVDVLFVHRDPGMATQKSASAIAAAIVSLLSDPTAEGVALRVDANLRPEGRSGPLSRSLASMLEYYERHAMTWERQAMLKARPVAGDLRLGVALVSGVAPFVYPAVLPASAIEEVRASKARIEELVRAAGKEASEVKRGRGGIRDVEFAVQLLQLVHGRRDERLRHTGTLGALDALAERGYVAHADAEMLASSYRFLRRLEHRLQMARDLQTHELPRDRRALGALARSLGLPDAAHLLDEYTRHTETIRGVHERLFYRPLLEAFAGSAVEVRPEREGTEELLAGLGFADPPAAYIALRDVVSPPDRMARVLGTLFPVVGPALAFAALPDAALVRFGRVVEAVRSDPAGSDRLADMLADRPDAARRLASLVAASSAFADALVARPGLTASLRELPSPERALFPGDSSADLVRVAGAFAAGDVGVPETGRFLAAVADGVVAEAVTAAAPELPLAAIALGKLGGEELSFASDLDVVFVYEGEGPADFEGACRAAERILAEVAAAGWQVDPDLRPEGRSGSLARSMASYLEYWERWAETWEYQSLLRARFIAGDEALGRRFLSSAVDFAFPERLTLEQVVAIRRMRVRMEEERVRPAEARRFHFKLGYGGLADVQFAVELSLMRHGFEHQEVRRTHTLEALEALASARLIEESVARSLADAYVFLTRVKSAMEIERRVPCEALPSTPEAQAALARRLGYQDRPRHRFLEDYRRITRKARSAMERVFYGDA